MNITSSKADAAERQPARKDNITALVSYFESGIKEREGAVGIELEHTLVGPDGQAIPYHIEYGAEWVLNQLLGSYPQAARDTEGALLGVARPHEAITLEPAAQIELSAGPFDHLSEALECFDAFERQMDSILAPQGMRALTMGYHPTATAESLSLIPKQRYAFMNSYLRAKGPFGICMMRGSASTQVSIDYSSTEDCLRKLRLAYALVPLLSLMCDNSPIFEGMSRTHQLVRTEIWQKCDPDRCGLVPGVMKADFTLQHYAEYILDTPAILVPNPEEEWSYTELTFGEIYAAEPMTRADVEHAVSMLFNDVRLKTYIELRPADALPVPYAIAYAGLIKGLFSSESSLQAMETLFTNANEASIEAAKEALMEKGYAANAYDRPAAELADSIMGIALAGLAENERPYLEPLKNLVAQRTTLACLAEQQA